MTDDTEWTCADCDHVQRGHRFKCEKCGHNFGTVAAAEVGELPSINWKDGKPYSYCPECGRSDLHLDAATIERCAQVAIKYGQHASNDSLKGICAGIAARIRALKDS